MPLSICYNSLSSSSNKPCFRKISSNHQYIDTSSRLSANEPGFFCHNFYPRARTVIAHQRNLVRHTFSLKTLFLLHKLLFSSAGGYFVPEYPFFLF